MFDPSADPNDSDRDAIESDSEEVESDEELRARLGDSILTRLAKALDSAAERFERAAKGESVFVNPSDLKATLALLNLAPELLEKFKMKFKFRNYGIPLIPICPFCGEGPGAHWPDDCPENPNPPEKYPHLREQ